MMQQIALKKHELRKKCVTLGIALVIMFISSYYKYLKNGNANSKLSSSNLDAPHFMSPKWNLKSKIVAFQKA